MARIRHVAFIVDEPKKLYDYYHRLFGVEQVRTSPSGSIHVVDPLFNLAFLQHITSESEVVNTHRADGAEANQTLGINHFGFIVDQLDEVLQRLPANVKRGESPQNGRPAEMRVVDPWGNNFDLSSRGFLGREENRLPGVRHVVLQAADPVEAARFYHSVLDLKEVRRTEDGGALLTDGEVTLAVTPRRWVERPGIQYVGIRVDDWGDLEARFEEFGADLPAPRAGEHEVRLRDPEGNLYAVSPRGWLE
ncbi:MAG TPA: VOC family protein [Chloroflexota bacterium]|nr:VOC family protein [Chloroflexota bacterium]